MIRSVYMKKLSFLLKQIKDMFLVLVVLLVGWPLLLLWGVTSMFFLMMQSLGEWLIKDVGVVGSIFNDE